MTIPFKWLTAVFATTLASSIVSMMAAFVGSEGADLQDLLKLQAAMVPISIAVVALCCGIVVRKYGYRSAFQKLRDHLPAWLLFITFAANSLVLIAELSFALIQHHTGSLRPWQEHLPAATAFSSSLALAACYACFRLNPLGPVSD
jgi:uncharacterized membrane protein